MSGHTVPAPDRVLGSTGYHIRHVDWDLAIDAGTQLKKIPVLKATASHNVMLMVHERLMAWRLWRRGRNVAFVKND